MKISEIIEGLEEIKKQHGDLNCWYSEDDEGNNYGEVLFTPTLMFRLKHEKELRGIDELDTITQQNIEDYPNGIKDDNYKPLSIEHVVCIN